MAQDWGTVDRDVTEATDNLGVLLDVVTTLKEQVDGKRSEIGKKTKATKDKDIYANQTKRIKLLTNAGVPKSFATIQSLLVHKFENPDDADPEENFVMGATSMEGNQRLDEPFYVKAADEKAAELFALIENAAVEKKEKENTTQLSDKSAASARGVYRQVKPEKLGNDYQKKLDELFGEEQKPEKAQTTLQGFTCSVRPKTVRFGCAAVPFPGFPALVFSLGGNLLCSALDITALFSCKGWTTLDKLPEFLAEKKVMAKCTVHRCILKRGDAVWIPVGHILLATEMEEHFGSFFLQPWINKKVIHDWGVAENWADVEQRTFKYAKAKQDQKPWKELLPDYTEWRK